MSTIDVLLQTPDIVVLGPPSQIDLSLDRGSVGERGSKFFVGSGNPNNPEVLPSGQEFLLGDVFINVSVGAEFAWLYLYVQTPGGNIWTPAIRLQPGIYTENIVAEFDENGNSTISFSLSSIFSDFFISDTSRYVVHITPNEYENPISLTITSKDISNSNLEISINAIEYNSSWQLLEGQVGLGVTISVV
jgi:hypothetical protein